MAQRTIEVLIGRLLTDEEFRDEFLRDRERALGDLLERGFELSVTEIAAVIATDPSLWERAASGVDPRLQKARLCHPNPSASSTGENHG